MNPRNRYKRGYDEMIRMAHARDLDEVLEIVDKTVEVMSSQNNPQWSKEYPARSHFESDVAARSLYVYETDDGIIGFICINREEAQEYAGVSWSQDAPCFILHRMAVTPSARKKGIGMELIAFGENLAKEHRVYYLRTDTFSKNMGMNSLFKKCGFKKTGEVHFRGLTEPFNCYDKIL
ncbi:MAG: GNAT family N-acetyltransferase [Oscillospiraceae bacterium]|nr:GNAT family N-acetyltransferase [Oscillospiraceae bacterium]